MSLLIFSFRRQQIIEAKSRINMRLMQLQQKSLELQTYASNIADGSVSLNDLLTTPSSLFGRMMNFMQYSNNFAYQGAQQKMMMLGMSGALGQFGAVPPQQQQMYQSIMMQQLMQQERDRVCKIEQNKLNQEDKKVEQEIARLNTQLKMLEAEEQNVEKAEDKGIQSSTPKFGANG